MRPIVDLFDKRILFVTGKGGVGKTTVALALGLAAAAAGRRTIVCEVASQESTSRIFGVAEIGFHEVEVRGGLSAISIDPDRSIREYLELQLPVKAMGDLLYRSKIFNYLAAATPGLREMVTIGKIWELALEERMARRATPYDLVIVDAPATGHGLGLMQTPQNFAEIARVGPMANQASAINETITNHRKAGAVLVALPEEMPVNETATLESELIDGVGIAIDRIYMNAVYPQRFSAAELELIGDRLPGSGGRTAAALGAAIDCSQRASAHREQLDRLRELARTEVEELPFVFTPKLGVEDLGELAERIR
jgi:anion-transporting  ArsA/GET3 family ATPase